MLGVEDAVVLSEPGAGAGGVVVGNAGDLDVRQCAECFEQRRSGAAPADDGDADLLAHGFPPVCR